MTGIALFDDDDDDLSKFSAQFTNLGIDADRANALGQILAREAADPLAISERTDAEQELIAGVVDDLPLDNYFPCNSPDEFGAIFGGEASENLFSEIEAPSVSSNLLGVDPELDRILWGEA